MHPCTYVPVEFPVPSDAPAVYKFHSNEYNSKNTICACAYVPSRLKIYSFHNSLTSVLVLRKSVP